MKKIFATTLIVGFFTCCGLAAVADNWNNLTNPTDVPPKEIVNDMAKVAIGVTIVGAAVLVAGRSGGDITADFNVIDGTKDTAGSITVTISGKNGPYTVTGVSPAGNYSMTTSGNSTTITNVKPGEYDVTFKDSKGDTFTARTRVGGDKELSSAGANEGDTP